MERLTIAKLGQNIKSGWISGHPESQDYDIVESIEWRKVINYLFYFLYFIYIKLY